MKLQSTRLAALLVRSFSSAASQPCHVCLRMALGYTLFLDYLVLLDQLASFDYPGSFERTALHARIDLLDHMAFCVHKSSLDEGNEFYVGLVTLGCMRVVQLENYSTIRQTDVTV